MTIKAARDQQPDAWRPFTKPPRRTRDPLLNLDARTQALLDRSTLSRSRDPRPHSRSGAHRLKSKHTLATVKLYLFEGIRLYVLQQKLTSSATAFYTV